MIISLNWLKQYVDIKLPTDELVELIGSRLVEVESVTDISEKYRGILIVEVRVCNKIAGSDHLSQCLIWDGHQEVQIVCGAPNVRAGMLAVWLPPGVVLPETWNEEPLVLEKRKLMGVESNGMLASMRELGLGDDHSGIVEINPRDVKAGDNFAEVFGLNDTLLDIENKSLTHRPDCFGIVGFAREVAGILGQKFETKKWLTGAGQAVQLGDELNLKVKIDDPKLCPRYQAVVLELPKKSPGNQLLKTQTYLARSGMRSIDRVVDITNELMLLTGQPLHAFDYDKLVKVGGLDSARIIVRAAKPGEKLELLDGKTIEMAAGDIVITSNNVPVALAGAMGGANTAIDADTKRIVIESATFNLYNLRGTQFRHGIFSEAITRFTKGQPPALTDYVIKKAVEVYADHCHAKAISPIFDAYPKKISNKPVKVTVEQVNNLLGSDFTFDDIITRLENVGFKVKIDDSTLVCQTPYWRTDIHIPEDIIEEVGRLNGYDNIPAKLPRRDFTAVAPDALGDLKSKIRATLAAAGANEVLTYSFVSQKLLEKVGQDPKNSYKIINSISPELQYVRQSLLPSLLDKAYVNIKVPYDNFALFEMNQVYQKSYGLNDEKVPVLRDKVALVLADRKAQGSAYYDAKLYAEKMLSSLGIKFHFVPLTDTHASNRPFEPKRSAQIKSDQDESVCYGVVGELRTAVRRNFKLPEYVAGFELNLNRIARDAKNAPTVAGGLSTGPRVERDLTFQVNSDLEYAKLENLICKTLTEQNLIFELVPLSIYQGDDKSLKNISFRLTFASPEKTLSGREITMVIDNLTKAAKQAVKAQII